MAHPFEILADPVRRRIVEVLALGAHTAGNLSEVACIEFGVSRSTVSHHLGVLRTHEVVWSSVDEEEPRARLYRLNPAFLTRLDRQVGDLFELWEQRYGTAEGRAPLRGPLRGPLRPADATGHRFGVAERERRRRALAEWVPEGEEDEEE